MNSVGTADCFVCGKECTDWNAVFPGKNYTNFCGSCCRKLGSFAHHGEGWNLPRTSFDFQQKVAGLKANFVGAVVAKNAGVGFLEGPCKTCQRKNDIGNPKVKVCWNCGNQL
jgi:hypothetical protein